MTAAGRGWSTAQREARWPDSTRGVGTPWEGSAYSEVFGWQASEAMDMGALGKYHMFNRPHGTIGGVMNKPPEMAHVPANWQIYFRVPDITEATARITANGGQILNGPMEVPGGDWIVNGKDPQGAAFALHAKPA